MTEKENNVIGEVDSFYKELKELHVFASQRILPKLDAKLRATKPTPKEHALRDTFIRMYLVIGSVIKLNHYKDFHVLASILRVILELYVDMHLLDKEKIANGFEKFAEFTNAKKFSIAKARKNWAERNIFPFDEKFPKRASYLQTMESKGMSKKILQLWDAEKCPNHWSGLCIPDRVAKLGSDFLKEMFIRVYDLGNWYIHSGPVDWQGLQDGTLTNIIAGFAYGSTCEMFCVCCDVCIDHFNLQLDCANK